MPPRKSRTPRVKTPRNGSSRGESSYDHYGPREQELDQQTDEYQQVGHFKSV